MYNSSKARASAERLYAPAPHVGAVSARCYGIGLKYTSMCFSFLSSSYAWASNRVLMHKEKIMNFYLSDKWKHKRKKILRRDGYLCQISKRYGKMIPAETVHHIFPRDEFPQYSLEDWNLISLCKAKHDELHDRTSNRLTAKGVDLLRRTCRRYGKEVPDKYKEA